ncbi:DUF6538 domain-containing protein [Bosea minatitlanensis]|uniref:DUF6538 domain-containing protein n=1 Tax=Bosea minatitlanensis TaxID=128782 RepID=A0ABW0F3T1_9HYPH
MYLFRRGSHWWIRKAVPVDLVEILGIAQVRRSLRRRSGRTSLPRPGTMSSAIAVVRVR